MTALTPNAVMWLPAAETLRPRLDRKLRRLLDRLLLMSGSEGSILSGQLLSQVFGGVIYTPPDHVYLGLWTSALTRTSDGDTTGETTYTSYARTEIGTGNNQEDAWDVPVDDGSSASLTNLGDVSCPTCTGSTATITYAAILDETESGNILVWFSTNTVTVSSGVTPILNASALTITRT